MKRQALDDMGIAPVYDRDRITSREKGSRNDRYRRQKDDDSRKRSKVRHKGVDEKNVLDGLTGGARLAAACCVVDDA